MPTLYGRTPVRAIPGASGGAEVWRVRGRTFDSTLAPVIYVDGWAQDPVSTVRGNWRVDALLAVGYEVLIPWTGVDWGSGTPISAVGGGRDAIGHALTLSGASAAHLYGVSHGALDALNWAWRNPTDVLGLYLLTPVVDIPSVWAGPDALLTATIESVYGAGLPTVTSGSANYDPIRNLASIVTLGARTEIHAVVDDGIVAFAGVQTVASSSGATLTTSATGGHAGAWSGSFDEFAALRLFTAQEP